MEGFTNKWLVVGVYSMAALLSSAAWIVFAPIATSVAVHYSTTSMWINWLSLSYLALYFPGSILSVVVSSRVGLRAAFRLSCIGMSLGLWIKVVAERGFIKPNFELLLFGQAIVALSSPFLTNSSPRVAAVWMPVHFRDTAIVIMNMFSYFGMTVGTTMSSSLDLSVDELLMYQAIAGSFIVVAAYIFFAEAPRKAPSASERHRRTVLARALSSQNNSGNNSLTTTPNINHIHGSQSAPSSPMKNAGAFVDRTDEELVREIDGMLRSEHINNEVSDSLIDPDNLYENEFVIRVSAEESLSMVLWHIKSDIAECFKSRSFRLLAASTFLIGGVYNAMVTLIESFCETVGYGSTEAGALSNALVLCGIVASFILGAILDRTHYYSQVYKLLFIGATLSIAAFAFKLRPGEINSMIVSFAMFGALSTPNAIVSFSLGAELTFPLKEDVSATVLATLQQIAGVPLTVILAWLIDFEDPYDEDKPFVYHVSPATSFLVLAMALGTALTMFIEEDNRRQRMEETAAT